jgi:hypothetical protein
MANYVDLKNLNTPQQHNLYGLNLSTYVGILTLNWKFWKNITNSMKHREVLHK